jgi:hypothetical protein
MHYHYRPLRCSTELTPKPAVIEIKVLRTFSADLFNCPVKKSANCLFDNNIFVYLCFRKTNEFLGLMTTDLTKLLSKPTNKYTK